MEAFFDDLTWIKLGILNPSSAIFLIYEDYYEIVCHVNLTVATQLRLKKNVKDIQ